MTLAAKNRALLGALALATALVGLVLLASSGDGAPARPAELPVFRVETDHATYSSVGSAAADADLIVRGAVQSHSTDPGTSPGVDGLGDPLPAIPHTDYVVSVLETLKGSLAPGATIVVSLTGGTTETGRFVLDGGPEIGDGEVAVFFLRDEGGGKVYPLAGGAAVAHQAADGSFVLPVDATGTEPVRFVPSDIAAPRSTSPGSQGSSPSPPAATKPPSAAKKPKCKRGFKARKSHGKKRCVKAKKKHRKAKKKHRGKK